MKTNIGSIDVGVRFVGGCLIALAGVHAETWWGLLALPPLLTGISAYCPLYAVLHIDTTACDK
jgi:hypothetical protein